MSIERHAFAKHPRGLACTVCGCSEGRGIHDVPEKTMTTNLHPHLHAQLAAILAALLPELKWRHHGIGVLQAYVRENDEPEVRVHIWDPRLVREGIRACGDAHDHRFDLESTVIVGEICETVFWDGLAKPLPSAAVLYDTWRVQNARAAGAAQGFDGECTLLQRNVLLAPEHRTHLARETYTLPRGVFHRTQVDKLTVTVCTMREKRGQARILVPAGQEPVHAFGGEPAPEKLQSRIIAEAIEILDRAAVRSF